MPSTKNRSKSASVVTAAQADEQQLPESAGVTCSDRRWWRANAAERVAVDQGAVEVEEGADRGPFGARLDVGEQVAARPT